MGLLAIIDSFLETIKMPVSKFLKGTESVRSMVEPLLFKKGIPAVGGELPIHPTKEELEQKFPSPDTPKIKSDKGIGILIALILIVLVLIPLLPEIIVLLLIGYVVNFIRFHKKMNE